MSTEDREPNSYDLAMAKHELLTSQQTGLYTALAMAQGQMQHAAKDAKNPHFRNTYATLASCLDAIRGPFAAHGLAVIQQPGYEDGRVTLTTIVTHTAGGSMASTMSAKPQKDTPQALGSCITYLRRYALQAMCGIASEDDDGEGASAPNRQQKPVMQSPKVEPLSVDDFYTKAAAAIEQSDEQVRAFFGYRATELKKQPIAEADDAMRWKVLAWLQGPEGSVTAKTWITEQELF